MRRCCRNAGGAADGRRAVAEAQQWQPRRGRNATAPGSAARPPYSTAVASEDERDDDGDADQGRRQQQQPRPPHRRDTEQTATHATPPTAAAAGHFRSRAAGHATHCTSGYVTCTAEVSRSPSRPAKYLPAKYSSNIATSKHQSTSFETVDNKLIFCPKTEPLPQHMLTSVLYTVLGTVLLFIVTSK